MRRGLIGGCIQVPRYACCMTVFVGVCWMMILCVVKTLLWRCTICVCVGGFFEDANVFFWGYCVCPCACVCVCVCVCVCGRVRVVVYGRVRTKRDRLAFARATGQTCARFRFMTVCLSCQARMLFMMGVFVPIFLMVNIALHMRRKELYLRKWARYSYAHDRFV